MILRLTTLALICVGQLAMAGAVRADEFAFFESQIRPVLVRHCYECHSSAAADVKGGLVLDFREGIRTGGESGPAVVPGKPEESLLLDAMRHESFEMPPARKLPDSVITDFEEWIRSGAADPRDVQPSPASAAAESWKVQLRERRNWWSLQPPRHAPLPTVTDVTWSMEPIDRYIKAALDDVNLTPAKPAEAEVLLRRLSLVLTGLPPDQELVKTFPNAYAAAPDRALEALVDRTLASPHFGERLARHWMDVVRYTDTYGYEWDIPAKGSWEYRDYLIRAYNDDVGFDQLIREQLAGDLLPEPRINNAEGVNESLIGPMFFHLGEHRHGNSMEFNGIHQEMINNKVDAFSKAFLGMTVACARCHDHKLDAISQHDYYALAGVFMTPRWTARSIDAPGRNESAISELRRLRTQIQEQLAAAWTTTNGPLESGRALREWAVSHRPAFENATIQDVSWPFAGLVDVPDGEALNVWRKLAEEWRDVREKAQVANAAEFSVLTDFSEPGFPDDWAVEGDGLRHGYVRDGTVLVSLESDVPVSKVLPRGYHTHALSSKLSGAVRLPAAEQFPLPWISLRIAGGEWAGRRDIPQNAFLSEGPVFFDAAAAPAWTSFTGRPLNNGVTRVLTEITTASLNSNFPPRTGVARAGQVTLPDRDEGFGKRSWLSVTGIVTHGSDGKPQDTRDAFQRLFEESGLSASAETGAQDPWQQMADWLAGSVNDWAAGRSDTGNVQVINWLLQNGLLPNDFETLPEIAALVKQYRQVESRIAFPRSANSMDERGVRPVDYRVNVRGDVNEEGDAVRRDFLEVFAGTHDVGHSAGSGRLELARYLSSRDNPQTARVYVNRVWQWVFGKGLVATPDDFGKLGERPSHPELLDWLAIRFMEDGWSTKTLVRQLVLSRTFRQAGSVDPAAFSRDPDNRLLHHYPTRRMEAEAIRDAMFAVSGQLDGQLYGQPINPPRMTEDSAKRLFSGPIDSHGRRSLYIEMSIMDPPKFLKGFNLPDLKLPTGRRDVTNGPAQALILLNDPLVVQLAERWAERLVEDGSADCATRIESMFIRAFGRLPKAAEKARWTAAVTAFADSNDVMNDQAAWSELAHVLFNTKEFIYYR